MQFKGTVTSGLNEGAYYVEIYKEKIKEVLGIVPFPGTLNLKCGVIDGKEVKEILKNLKFKEVASFDGFKGVKFIKCEIKSEKNKENKKGEKKPINTWLVIPEIKKHGFIEMISDVNLRKELCLNNGDAVEIYLD